jgi:hypothetical protein
MLTGSVPPHPPPAVRLRRLDAKAAESLLRDGVALPTVYLYGPRGRLRLRVRGNDRDTVPTLVAALNARSFARPRTSRWPTLATLWQESRAAHGSSPTLPPPGRPSLVEVYAGWDPACRRLKHALLRLAARLPPRTRPRVVTLAIPFLSRHHASRPR